MATPTRISLEEYLRYPGRHEPDAEYVDGEIHERPMGQDDHSACQLAIQFWFAQHATVWNIRVRPELRVQVSPTRFRIPDVSILDRATPREQIATHPPLAVFEVLSPEDTVNRMRTKLADYQTMGIQAIWVIDPEMNYTQQFIHGMLEPCSVFELPARGISFDMAEIAKLVD